jgi:selenocysteine lyase/cysteine desulfurase
MVVEAARVFGIAVRGGCFCNPGCAEAAFEFPAATTAHCLDALGDGFTVPRFASCLGDRTVGAIRISLGLGSVRADVDRVLAFLERYVDSGMARAVVHAA